MALGLQGALSDRAIGEEDSHRRRSSHRSSLGSLASLTSFKSAAGSREAAASRYGPGAERLRSAVRRMILMRRSLDAVESPEVSPPFLSF